MKTAIIYTSKVAQMIAGRLIGDQVSVVNLKENNCTFEANE